VPMFAEGGFVLGTLPSERIAGEDIETKRVELELAREETVFNVTSAYFSVLKADQDVLLAEEALKVYENLLAEARVEFEREMITKDDLFSVELLVTQARKDLVVARNTHRLMIHNLAFEMGIDPSETIRLEESFPPAPELPPLEDLIAIAQSRRQEIAVQEFAVRSARDSLDLSRAGRYPTANVSSVYRLSDDFKTPIQAQDWRVIFSVTVPIFDFGETRAKIVQGTHTVRAAEETLAQVKLSVIQEIVQAYSDFQNQKESRAILELQIEQARQALKINKEKFQQQLIPISAILAAQQTLLGSEKALIKADYDAQIQIALLRKAVGGSLTP